MWRVEWCLRQKHLPGTRHAEQVLHHRNQARATYERLRREHPDKGREQLLKLAPSDVKWLRRRDKVWLAERQPERRRAAPSATDALWRARDAEIRAEVDGAVQRLRELPHRRRATVTGILRSMGRMDALPELDRLPGTRVAIEAAVESEEAFAVRKLERAVAQYRAEGVVPRPWQLRARAGLGSGDYARLRDQIQARITELAGVSVTAGGF